MWSALESRCENAGDLLAGFDKKFNLALEALREEAYSLVRLPEGRLEVAGGTLIRRIIGSLRDGIANYDHALARCDGDPARDAQSFSDVLRIAYNFASDSSKLINLIVGICDLKPLLLWATIAEHSKKSGNALEYEDQELVDILTQFTHAPETVVPAEFWKKNSRVVHALENVFVATERALVLLHNERVGVGV